MNRAQAACAWTKISGEWVYRKDVLPVGYVSVFAGSGRVPRLRVIPRAARVSAALGARQQVLAADGRAWTTATATVTSSASGRRQFESAIVARIKGRRPGSKT